MLIIIACVSILLAATGVTLMFYGTFIPAPQLLIIAGVALLLLFVITKKIKGTSSPKMNRLMSLSVTFLIVMTIASLVYRQWGWESFLSNMTVLKIVLVILGLIGIYMNMLYMRAESNYRRKRGNQRIKDRPTESYPEFKKTMKQSKKKDGEITCKIGESLEHADVPVILKEKDFFTHSLFVGSTGSGKTASILEPIAYQLLVQKKLGKKLGLTVVEPKRDFALKVKEFCEGMDIPHIFIDPLSEDTKKFNPMEGEINDVAEATVVVLKGLFGKQEAFFASVQELSARYITKLLKELHRDNMDILDVMNTLRDPQELKKKVEQLKARDGVTELVHFFEAELLGQHGDKYRQLVIGLRAQLENITSNDLLKRIMTGKSDVDIQKHFAEGGVLIVNTELGKLGTSGDAFGQFMIMHLQNGTFNRPGPEKSRIPHFMMVDEYSRYINPEIERFLSIARSYRVAGIFATQSLGQLELESGKISAKAMKRAIFTNCRNKIAFGGMSHDDALEFAEEFGKDKIIMRQSTYKHRIFMPVLFPDSYRDTETEEYRFDPTDIMDDLPKYSYIHKMMFDGQMQKPSLATGNLVPEDWKKKQEWKDKRLIAKIKRAGTGAADIMKDVLKERKENKQVQKEALSDRPIQETEHTNYPSDGVGKREEQEAPRGVKQVYKVFPKEEQTSGESNPDSAPVNQENKHSSPRGMQKEETEQKQKDISAPVSDAGDGFWD